MALKKFKLIKKEKLTSDVFELVFEAEEKIEIKPGQFITFILPKIGGRAYSIAKVEDNKMVLLIKRWCTKTMEGRGGSEVICDLEIGGELNGVGPAGHFLLKQNSTNKMFVGTGTGLAPLYNQILGSIELNQNCELKLIFGVRTMADLFYIDKLEEIKKVYNKFSYEVYLSREESEYNKGYVTDYLNANNCSNFTEYYICGAPEVVDSTHEKLKSLGVDEENIFDEKY